jgi:hypothetical protein
MIIRICQDSGITLANLPAEFFEFFSSYNMVDCDIMFETSVSIDDIKLVLDAYYIDIEYERNLFATNIKKRQEVPNNVAQLVEEIDLIQPIEMRRIPDLADIDLDEPGDGDADDDLDLHGQVVDPGNYRQSGDVPDEELPMFIAAKMKNALSSSANIIIEDMNELNRLMAKAVFINQKIKKMMKPILQDEKVSQLISQIEFLKTEDNLIEKINICRDGWLYVKTKNIVTEVLGDGSKRNIGEMLLKINLNILLSPAGMPEPVDLISIHNLTRSVRNSSGRWECGHVLFGGNVCLGNAFDQLYHAMVDLDLVMACNVLIKFIKNPDIDDAWGMAAKYFPVELS